MAGVCVCTELRAHVEMCVMRLEQVLNPTVRSLIVILWAVKGPYFLQKVGKLWLWWPPVNLHPSIHDHVCFPSPPTNLVPCCSSSLHPPPLSHRIAAHLAQAAWARGVPGIQEPYYSNCKRAGAPGNVAVATLTCSRKGGVARPLAEMETSLFSLPSGRFTSREVGIVFCPPHLRGKIG